MNTRTQHRSPLNDLIDGAITASGSGAMRWRPDYPAPSLLIAPTLDPTPTRSEHHDMTDTATATAPATPDYGPWPYEADLDEPLVTPDELGARALAADATPAQRARAEATWRMVLSGFPCRCSGPCHHDQPCGEDNGDGSVCPGHDLHVDRQAGSMFSMTMWQDTYACDTCGSSWESGIDLPDLPFGEYRPGGAHTIMHIYADVRHPNFPESWPGDHDLYDEIEETDQRSASVLG